MYKALLLTVCSFSTTPAFIPLAHIYILKYHFHANKNMQLSVNAISMAFFCIPKQVIS